MMHILGPKGLDREGRGYLFLLCKEKDRNNWMVGLGVVHLWGLGDLPSPYPLKYIAID
jgi:hypothetical protein|uniref:Uncharacterized protein n=2 Tax=Picea TaxID=3328 RepID=A0A6B9XQY4_PICSI|nr:hypothetical protein Q903MT_gene4021 [Picea sitchensis]